MVLIATNCVSLRLLRVLRIALPDNENEPMTAIPVIPKPQSPVDPLSEAEVLESYGRAWEAIDALKAAIAEGRIDSHRAQIAIDAVRQRHPDMDDIRARHRAVIRLRRIIALVFISVTLIAFAAGSWIPST